MAMGPELDDKDIRRAMQALGRTLNSDKASRAIKRELSKRLRKAAEPMVAKRKAAVLRLPTKGHSGAGMRQAIARQIKAQARYKGDATGVSITQRARGMPRNFRMAGRAFNRSEGWHPKNLGGVEFHQQITPVEWFDKVAESGSDQTMASHEIIAALEDVAARLASEIRRI